MRDPYEVLGVQKTATADEITKAYRKLAMQHHPDRNPGDAEAEDRFKEVSAAYEILSNADKRRQFDAYGHVGRTAPPGNAHRRGKPFSSAVDDFFSNFFNQRATSGGEHVHVSTDITLEQACHGATVEIKFQRTTPCKTCGGAGGLAAPCQHCGGAGFKTIIGESHTIKTSCHACDGAGKVFSGACPDCDGGVAETTEETIPFKIPPGVESGMRFAHGGLGNPTADDPTVRGNLYITVRVSEHDLFKRLPQGNVFLEVPVSYTQLVLGAEVDVPTVGGKQVSFKVPRGTQDGSKFRLADMGMPIFNNGGNTYQCGDQFVQVRLDVPTQVDEKYESLLRELAGLEQANITTMRQNFLNKMGDANGRAQE